MYARYIPPPRGPAQSLDVQQVVKPPLSPPAKPQPTSYARYIPPSKSSPSQSGYGQPSHHVRFEQNNDDKEPRKKKAKLTESDRSAPKLKRKAESSKTSKRGPQPSAEDPGESARGESPVLPATQDGAIRDETINLGTTDQSALDGLPDPAGQVREKRGKKKTKREDPPRIQNDVVEETPVRHRTVLEKAAKSIRAFPPQLVKNHDENVTTRDTPDGDGRTEMGVGDATTNVGVDVDVDADADAAEVHGLQPLPQPRPAVPDTMKPMYETLPLWLARPVRVSPQSVKSFTDLGLSPDLGITPEVAERLAANGYEQAFAIQTAMIPLLLPHHDKKMHGDILVSAATGSGKTLAYTLPLIRDLSYGNRHLTRLRAVIVLPTRELVKQVQLVCEQCAGVFALNGIRRRVRIGIAMGSQSVDQEQTALVEREEQYDPESYAERNRRIASKGGYGSGTEGDESYDTEDEERAAIQKREDNIRTLPEHAVAYKSKVDVLICTPGRLVEHIKYTPGFSLDFVRWLVVDEADKLLGQNFQQWLGVIIPLLQSGDMGLRNLKQSNLSGVRKVVLSATMTRDLDRLEGLKLRRPTLVMLEGSGNSETKAAVSRADLTLPDSLQEAAVKVGDPNLKPLFLLDLLRSEYLTGRPDHDRAGRELSDDETSSSGSDSEPDSGSEVSFKPPGVNLTESAVPSILIFTKSNEAALRLSRLLSLLSPTLSPRIGTLTSTTPYATRRRTIRSFLAGKLRTLVASDLVARGIDLPSLDHVINYDMPSSVASYVHRVGRTARAGKVGKAWTLFTNSEARWFWNEIAGEATIQRSKKVERVRVTEEKEDEFERKVAAYELALAKLGEEASEWTNQGR